MPARPSAGAIAIYRRCLDWQAFERAPSSDDWNKLRNAICTDSARKHQPRVDVYAYKREKALQQANTCPLPVIPADIDTHVADASSAATEARRIEERGLLLLLPLLSARPPPTSLQWRRRQTSAWCRWTSSLAWLASSICCCRRCVQTIDSWSTTTGARPWDTASCAPWLCGGGPGMYRVARRVGDRTPQLWRRRLLAAVDPPIVVARGDGAF